MQYLIITQIKKKKFYSWGYRGRDHMVVGFTTTCAISAYHHLSVEFVSVSCGIKVYPDEHVNQ